MKEKNVIVDLTLQFALDIIDFAELLEKNRKFVVANQLIKAGTSIGANVKESQNAESKAYFIHKIKIAAKEADETEYWLMLCKYSKTYPINEELLNSLESIQKVLSKIISTSKKSSHQLISTSAHQHINSSANQHINTLAHQHISTLGKVQTIKK